MKNLFYSYFILIQFILYPIHAISQYDNELINKEPGKCYAKCRKNTIHQDIELSFPIYVGNTPSKVKIDTIEILINEAYTIWRKKESNSWCLEQIPEKREIVYTVDTTTTSEYEFEYFTIREIVEYGGKTEWIKVICGDKLTSLNIRIMQNNLLSGGYKVNVNGKLDMTTKEAITKFQQDNNLPFIGQLDQETLNSLGIAILL